MRELKFRAWHKKTKSMRTVKGIYWGKVTMVHLNSIEIEGHTDARALKFLELMQFTNVRDAKGKKIFEGDIVKNISSNVVRVVERKITQSYSGFNIGANPTGRASYVVIGNIYENKELLK